MPDQVTEELKINSVLRDRKIYIVEEIDRDSIFKALYYLECIENLDAKREDGKKDDIEIVIDSNGGSIYSALAMVSKMQSMINSGYNIITTVLSVAMSAGSFISMCGSQRRALKYSRFMFHSLAGGGGWKHEEIGDDLKELDCIWELVKKITAEKTLITEEQLEDTKERKRDWYMWSDEALKLNVIDEIL